MSTKNRSGRYSEIKRREAIARERPRARAGMRDPRRLINLRVPSPPRHPAHALFFSGVQLSVDNRGCAVACVQR